MTTRLLRSFAAFSSLALFLGFSVAACAVDGTEEPESSEGSEALQGPVAASKAINKCLTVKCAAGYTCQPKTGACVPNQPTICQLSKCAQGYHCEEPVGCVPNVPADCRTLGCAKNQFCSACANATSIIFACIPNGAAC